MKEALLKKRYGILAALLLVLLLSGTALAWYGFNTISSDTTIEESLSTTDNTDFSATMHPGETNTWSFKIKNSADVAYTVKADLTSTSNGVSVNSFKVGNIDETDDLLDDGTATFNIPANRSTTCGMIVSAAKDIAPGKVSVSLDLSRG